MDDFCKELEKVIKAGIGAVATGVEKAQEAVENLAQKGEPIFQQAKEKVNDAADKVVKAFQEVGKPKVEGFLHDARAFTLEELKELRQKLDELICDLENANQPEDVVEMMDTPTQNQPEE